MDIDEILKEVIAISRKSKRLKTPVRVALRLTKSEIHYGYTTGNILITDELVREFDLFCKYDGVLMNIEFDGLGRNKVSVSIFDYKMVDCVKKQC